MKSTLRPRPAPSRSMLYFELLEALDSPRCPICMLAQRAVARHFDLLSYEGVNDPGFRSDLRASRGFCSWHAWQFITETRDSLGVAIIYEDLLSVAATALQAAARPSFRGRAIACFAAATRRLRRALRPSTPEPPAPAALHAACPACRFLAQFTRACAQALAAALAQPIFRARYAESHGLCRPHLIAALNQNTGFDDCRLLVQTALPQSPAASGHAVPNDGPSAAAVVALAVGAPGIGDILPWRTTSAAQAFHERRDPPVPARTVTADGDCHLCTIARECADRCLASLTTVQDEKPPAAAAAVQAGDLCNAHAWRSLELPRSNRSPAIWPAAVQPFIARLRPIQDCLSPGSQNDRSSRAQHRARRITGRRLAAALARCGRCPACATQDTAVRAAAWRLAHGPPPEPAGASNNSSVSLCLPHAYTVLHAAESPEIRRIVAQDAVARCQELQTELHEHVRKHNNHYRGQPWGTERDAPWRAIALAAGAQSLAHTETTGPTPASRR